MKACRLFFCLTNMTTKNGWVLYGLHLHCDDLVQVIVLVVHDEFTKLHCLILAKEVWPVPSGDHPLAFVRVMLRCIGHRWWVSCMN